jgi:hypothetical protein
MAITNNYKENVVDLVQSFTNADKLTFGEALVNDIVVDNEIELEKTVVYGVKNGDVVPIIEKNDSYTMFPVASETVCGTSECDLNVNLSATIWDLALIKCKIPICLNSFDKEFLAFFNTYRKFDNDPDLDQVLLQYLGEQFKQGLENAKWRRAYFADQASNSPLLDGSDGFWTKADASAVVGDNKIVITKNSAGTAALQRMTFEEIYELLGDMYELAVTHTWFDPSTFRFEMPWSMGLTYMSGLNKMGHQAPANCQCLSADGIVKAGAFTLENIAFNGIPIKVFRAFDGVINQVPALNGNNVAGASKVDPNRVLLVKNENMLIGSSDETQLTFEDIWYNKDDEKIYMRGGSYIGAAFPKVNELILAI